MLSQTQRVSRLAGHLCAGLTDSSHDNTRVVALESQDAAETEARLNRYLFSHNHSHDNLDSPRCCGTDLGPSQRRPDLALCMGQRGDGCW